jgi:hypothetical protein
MQDFTFHRLSMLASSEIMSTCIAPRTNDHFAAVVIYVSVLGPYCFKLAARQQLHANSESEANQGECLSSMYNLSYWYSHQAGSSSQTLSSRISSQRRGDTKSN